jgi:hypothetical protein
LDFGSVAAFDRHRVGTHEYTFIEGLYMEPERLDGRRCLDESEIAALTDSKGRSIYGLGARGQWSLRASLEYARQARSGEQYTSQGT